MDSLAPNNCFGSLGIHNNFRRFPKANYKTNGKVYVSIRYTLCYQSLLLRGHFKIGYYVAINTPFFKSKFRSYSINDQSTFLTAYR